MNQDQSPLQLPTRPATNATLDLHPTEPVPHAESQHVEELYCVPVRYAVEFRAALFAVVSEPLGKIVVQKKPKLSWLILAQLWVMSHELMSRDHRLLFLGDP